MKCKLKFNLIILLVLSIETNLYFQVLINLNNSNYEEISTIRTSQSTTSIEDWTPYGSAIGGGHYADKHDYLEWSLNTSYGPGFTWYIMNDTEFWEMGSLPYTSRTRENLKYTALLSDEERSASGTFYPLYSDIWWFVSINHYTGVACSVTFSMHWLDDYISILEPTGYSGWGINSSQYINWTWGGDFTFVDINLYYDRNFLANIVMNTENNGSFLWRIPDSISEYDDLFQINISNSDNPKIWDVSDAYFIIEPKSINIIDPSVGDSLETKYNHIITWDSTGFITSMKIDLYKNNIFELEIISSTPNDGLYFWPIPSELENSTQYQIKISDISDYSVYNYSDFFEIYTMPSSPPNSINIIDPSASDSLETKAIYIINWSFTGSITDVKLDLYKNNNFELEIISSTPNDGQYFWTIPSELENSTQYQIKITDVSNSSLYDFSEFFEICTIYSAPNSPNIPGYNLWIFLDTIIMSIIGIYAFVTLNLRKNKKRRFKNQYLK